VPPLTRRLLRRGDFASRDDLETQITAYTVRCNRTDRSYLRRYDAEHARYLERHTQHPRHPDAFDRAACPSPTVTGNRQRTCDALHLPLRLRRSQTLSVSPLRSVLP
jgi:hypothetical protein